MMEHATRQRGHDLTPATSLIDANDSILVVIDLQPGFLRKLDPAMAERVVDRARFVATTAIRLGIPFVATVESPAENGLTSQTVRSVLGDAPYEWDKRVFGCGDQENIRTQLIAQPRRTAILVGLETDVCILHSAVSLAAWGFRSVIVRDAVGSPGDAHRFGLERAERLGVELIHAKGLYYEWLRDLATLTTLGASGNIAAPTGIIL